MFARWIAWLNLWNIHTEKTLNRYLHSTSDCRSLAIEGFPLTRLRNLRTWHNLKLINCLNWLSDRMIVLYTCTKFACAFTAKISEFKKSLKNFISFPRPLNIQLESTNKQFCFSDNVAVCGMAKCFCFRRKSKNWKLKIAINFPFSAKTFQTVDRTTQEGGGGAIRTVIFFCPPFAPYLRGLGRKWEFNCLFAIFHNVLERLVSFRPSVLSIKASSQTLDVSYSRKMIFVLEHIGAGDVAGMEVKERKKEGVNFLYTRVQRGNKRVNCPAQEHKPMSLTRAQIQTPWSGDKHTNHEASVLTLWVAHKNITAAFYNREICCLLGSFFVEGSPECKILLKSYQGIFLWKQWCGIFSVSSKYGACSDETFLFQGWHFGNVEAENCMLSDSVKIVGSLLRLSS